MSDSTLQERLSQGAELTEHMFGEDKDEVVSGIPIPLVEAFVMGIARLAQGNALYDKNNDLLKQMWARLEADWRKVQAYEAEVKVKFFRDHIAYGGEEIFRQDDRQENIAIRLYRDGVRTMSFLPTLNMVEVEKLLSIFELTDDMWQREADLVDRLWLLDLEHIKYTAIDGFDQFVEETDGEALARLGRGLSLMTGQVPNAEEIWGTTKRYTPDMEEIYELVEETEHLALMHPDEFWKMQLGDVTAIISHFNEMAQFVSSVPVPTIPEMVLEIVLRKMFIEQLKFDNEHIGTRIQKMLTTPGLAGQRLVNAWSQAAVPELFAELLAHEAPGSSRYMALWTLMRDFMTVAPERLADGIVRLEADNVASALVKLLHTKVPDPFWYWLPRADDIRAGVMREILYNVPESALEQGNGKTFLGHVWLTEDPDVFHVLCNATPASLLPLLRQALMQRIQSEDVEIRIGAANALRRLNDPATGIFVLNEVRKMAAAGKEIDERELEVLLRTLMAIGGERYVDFLAQALGPMATGEGGLFGKKRAMRAHTNPLGDRPVLLALARYGSPRAWELIRKVYGKCDEPLKEYIRILRRDWEGQPAGDPDRYTNVDKKVRPETPLYTGPAVHMPSAQAPPRRVANVEKAYVAPNQGGYARPEPTGNHGTATAPPSQPRPQQARPQPHQAPRAHPQPPPSAQTPDAGDPPGTAAAVPGAAPGTFRLARRSSSARPAHQQQPQQQAPPRQQASADEELPDGIRPLRSRSRGSNNNSGRRVRLRGTDDNPHGE